MTIRTRHVTLTRKFQNILYKTQNAYLKHATVFLEYITNKITFDSVPYRGAIFSKADRACDRIDRRIPGGQRVRVPDVTRTSSSQRVTPHSVMHLLYLSLQLFLMLRDDSPLAISWRQTRGGIQEIRFRSETNKTEFVIHRVATKGNHAH